MIRLEHAKIGPLSCVLSPANRSGGTTVPASRHSNNDPIDIQSVQRTGAATVRRPQSQAWRHTFTLSVIVAAASDDYGSRARPMCSEEIGAIIGSFDGPSTSPLQVNPTKYTIVQPSSLPSYGAQLLLGPGVHQPPIEGTIRNWTEGLLLGLALAQSKNGDAGEEAEALQRHLADEVLRSVRMTSLWSAVIQTEELHPAFGSDYDIAGNTWWPIKRSDHGGAHDDHHVPCDLTDSETIERVPTFIQAVFDGLCPHGHSWFPPSPSRRVDQLYSVDRSWLSWAPPQRPCVVTVHAAEAEAYPRSSWLNLFGRFAHMTTGASTCREVLLALARESDLEKDSLTQAQRNRDLFDELEEMYDLEVAEIPYRRFYSRLRRLRGLEDQYRRVRDRAGLLGQYREAAEKSCRGGGENCNCDSTA